MTHTTGRAARAGCRTRSSCWSHVPAPGKHGERRKHTPKRDAPQREAVPQRRYSTRIQRLNPTAHARQRSAERGAGPGGRCTGTQPRRPRSAATQTRSSLHAPTPRGLASGGRPAHGHTPQRRSPGRRERASVLASASRVPLPVTRGPTRQRNDQIADVIADVHRAPRAPAGPRPIEIRINECDRDRHSAAGGPRGPRAQPTQRPGGRRTVRGLALGLKLIAFDL